VELDKVMRGFMNEDDLGCIITIIIWVVKVVIWGVLIELGVPWWAALLITSLLL
jgi:hypothetical protein